MGERRDTGSQRSDARRGDAVGRADDVIGRWAASGLPGRMPLAAYLTEAHAPLYRLVVDVLLAAQSSSLTGVGRDELYDLVATRLAERGLGADLLDCVDLTSRMEQLRLWGVVDVWQDRAVRDEDFLRNRDRYQLTAAAADLHRAILSLGEDETRTIAAVLAPAVIAEELARFADALHTDPAAAARSWTVLTTTMDAMARSAATWQSQLASALSGTPTPEKVAAARVTLTRYVEMWGAGIDTFTPHISESLARVLGAGDDVWRPVALAVVGADADDVRLDAQTAAVRDAISKIERWFTGPRPQAPRLRGQMASAVAPLIRSQRQVSAVGGHVSRSRELFALAARLSAAQDDEEAWHVWCVSTGLFSSAHHARASAEPALSATPSFWAAAPAQVEARLRKQGPRALTGRPAHMTDRSQARLLARAKASEDARRRAQLQMALLALSGTELADLPCLDDQVGQALVGLLAEAAGPLACQRRAARPSGHQRTGQLEHRELVQLVTSDQVWHLTITPLPGTAVVHVGNGRLVHPNLRLELELVSPGTPIVPDADDTTATSKLRGTSELSGAAALPGTPKPADVIEPAELAELTGTDG